MKRKPRQYSRADRKLQVIGQFSVWSDNGDNEPKTMQRIAKALDLVPSTKFRDILLEMETEGDLVTEMRDQSGRWTTRFYALSPARTLSRVVLKRRVVVKHRGVVSGQLEMQI
jgi:hypothetical protein